MAASADEAECLPVDVKSVDSMLALATDSAGLDRGWTGIAACSWAWSTNLPAGDGGSLARRKPPRSWNRARASPKNSCSAITFQRRTMPFVIPSMKFTTLCRTFTPRWWSRPTAWRREKAWSSAKVKKKQHGCRRDAQRQNAGRGRRARGAGRILKGDELSFLVVSDGERVAPLVARAGSQARGRWRHRSQHRRHGRLFDADDCR